MADKKSRELEARRLERECCGGPVFSHGRNDASGALRLEVRGVEPDMLLAELL